MISGGGRGKIRENDEERARGRQTQREGSQDTVSHDFSFSSASFTVAQEITFALSLPTFHI